MNNPLRCRSLPLTTFTTIALLTMVGCDFKTTNTDTAPDGTLSDKQNVNCGSVAALISDVQGSSDVSPLVGQTVAIEAGVTAIAPQLNGFFVQEEAKDVDDNQATSEGIFVFSEQSLASIAVGQLVRVSGVVQEIEGKTQLTTDAPAVQCGSVTIDATTFEFPVNDNGFEAYEGMFVDVAQSWVINNTHNLAAYGEIGVSETLLYTPTHMHPPSSDKAIALYKANKNKRIILDDFNAEGPDNLSLYGQFDANSPLRIGSQITSITGIVDESFNAYRIRLLAPPVSTAASRPTTPDIEGDITIASFNVLNLFNGDGQNGGFPTDRGAKSIAEYARQQTKIVNAIIQLKPDIIGINEIENDGDQGELSAVFQLTQALNTAAGSSVFDYRAYDSDINGASIANAIIFRKDKLKTVGETKVLTSQNSSVDGKGPLFFTEKSRPAITQAFSPIGSEKSFVVSVNHFKSKGSPCGENDDSREQGNCNLTRTRAATGLAQWLEQEYQGLPVFIIGDLNSYAQEDPIQALRNAGYTDVIRKLHGSQTYTYSFRGQLGALDYVMANDAASNMVMSGHEWHINAAEPRVLDYNATLPNSQAPKPDAWHSENVFRSSDHDPVVVGISL